MPADISRRKRGVPRKLQIDESVLLESEQDQRNNGSSVLSEIAESNHSNVTNEEARNLLDCNGDVRSESSLSRVSNCDQGTTNGKSNCIEESALNSVEDAGSDAVQNQRRRQYNVEVDPAKYRKVYDQEKGDIRFACSICGNVYKWRKSLNKHWKEKHRLEEPPPLDAPVPIKGGQQSNAGHFEMKKVETPHPAFARTDKLEPWVMAADRRSMVWTGSPLPSSENASNKDDVESGAQTDDQEQPLDLSTKRRSSSPTTDRKTRPSEMTASVGLMRPGAVQSPREPSHTTSGSQKYFICSVCQNKCPSLESANKHFQINHINALEREISGKSPPRNTNVAQQNEEWRLSDPKNPLKCVQCDFVGRWPTELQKHAASHSAMRPFKCLICSLTYKWRWDLAKHFDRAHAAFMNPYKKRDRDQAKTIIGQKHANGTGDSHFQDLMPSALPPKKKRRLLSTDASSDGSADFRLDACCLPAAHNDRKGFFCKWCGYHARWRSELFQHMRCHHARDKPYHCSACKYSSNWKWDVQKHVRKQHSAGGHEMARIVELPDKYLFNDITMESFVEVNVEDSVLKSKLIAAIIKSASALRCQQCPFVANCESEFTRHAIVHSDQTPYRCFACKFKSKWKSHIKKHMRALQHTGPILMNKSDFNRIKEAAGKSSSPGTPVNNVVANGVSGDSVNGQEDDYVVDDEDSDFSVDNNSAGSNGLGCQATFQCMACEAQANIFDLYEHFVSSHEEMTRPCANPAERWKCPVCLISFASFAEAIHHARSHPDLDLAEDEYLYNGLGVWADYADSLYNQVNSPDV